MKTSYLIILLFLVSLSKPLFVYSKSYNILRKSPPGGFSPDAVIDITQDKDGFMWFVLNNDIIRFDGKEYKSYFDKIKQKNISSLLTLKKLQNNTKNEIFVSSNQGVFKYDRLLDDFLIIYNQPTNLFSIDLFDNFWIEINNELKILNPVEKTTKSPIYNNNIEKTTIITHSKSQTFISDRGHNIYNHKTNNDNSEFELFFSFPSDFQIIDFYAYNQYMWVASPQKVVKINIDSKQIVDSINWGLAYAEPTNILIDKNENLWVGTTKELLLLNTQTKKTVVFKHEVNNETSLTFSSVWSIKEDLNKNIWVGTFSGGVNYIDIDNRQAFNTYNRKNGYLDIVASSFAEYRNNIYIGTEGNGLFVLDTVSNTMLQEKTNNNYYIKTLVIDSNKQLWAGTFRTGIVVYKIEDDGGLREIEKITTQNSKLLKNDIRKIVRDKNNDLWISYQLNQAVITHYSRREKTFTHYELDNSVKSSYVFDIVLNNNNIWIITRNTLYEFNLNNYQVNELFTEKTIPLNGQSLYLDSINLWIGTIGNGLLKYNLQNKEIEKYSFLTEYATSIYSILSDENHHLWIGTESGIIKMNKNTNRPVLYSINDGLQGLAFYPLAALKLQDKKLLFGGTNGFNVINTNLIYNTDDSLNIKTIISKIEINNKPSILHFSEENNTIENNTLILETNQNNLSISLSTNNFSQFNNNRFQYRMKEYQNEWIQTNENERTIFFNQIHSGHYTLEIKPIDNNKTKFQPFILNIYKKPHLWETWWAFLFYILLFLFILGYAYITHNKRKEKRYNRLKQNLEIKKEKEIRLAQTNFFVNVSHDLRTPLALILATIDNLKNENIQGKTFKILINNTLRLQSLVNELLDFKKIESTKLKTSPKATDVNLLIENIKNDFSEYANINRIDFETHLDDMLQNPIYIDPNHLEKILLNLLHNSFKNIKNEPSIAIESFSRSQNYKSIYKNHYSLKSENNSLNYFSILVRDNGLGIPSESLHSIFDSYKQVEDYQKSGTGIGLTVVKDLVMANRGTLDVYSEIDKGSDFLVSFPLEQSQNEENDIIEEFPINLSSEAIYLRDKHLILIVEDNTDLRYLIANFLGAKYEIEEAPNGEEACNIIKEKKIDLIISDIMMPVMDGIDLLKWVKQQDRYVHIPFMLLTAKTETTSKLDSISLGADLYFEKPIDLTLLLASIDNIFRQRENLKNHYANNYFADVSEISTNEKENEFLKSFIAILDKKINSSTMDINSIASELNISRSKLYEKVKTITGKTIVEFILQYKLRKAASLLLENNETISMVMDKVGIKSQSYFSTAFKKEFGETPSNFITKHNNQK